MDKLIDAVIAHAEANYGKGGWDSIVECWTRDEIAREIGTCVSERGAIQKMGRFAKSFGERRAEVVREIW
jgi:hypothetical protein